MQQNQLAKLLGITPAMVSRLKKRGMPTDTLERAERWRKRHLEPGRVKGSRFDPNQVTRPPATIKLAPLADAVAEVEAAGLELESALNDGDQAWTELIVQQVRESLRKMRLEADPNDEAEPRLSLRVWVALCTYVLNTDGLIERATNPGQLITPLQFCRYWRPDRPTYPLQNHHALTHACDWNDFSITGWPKHSDDDKWDAVAAGV